MIKNILVATELDDNSIKILNYAKEIAKKFESKIWLVHVASPEPDFVGYSIGPQYIRDFRANELRTEHKMIQKIAKELSYEGIDSDGLLIEGATTDMLLSECKKLNIDLICIGHKDYGWFNKLFGNNIDIEVIENTKIPVLTISLD